ncbi:MAG: dihydrolipoamide acetyltransferase family protein [Gemmatimonadota bacterium]
MARIDVIMPQMGESITEGTMSRWMKKVGDAVKRDEPIFEISTDKVDAEIPAPSAGVLAAILVPAGQTVEVGTIVARIETDAAAAASAPSTSEGPPAPAAAAPTPPADAAVPAPAPAAPAAPAEKPAASAPTPTPAAPAGDESAEERLKRKSTPLVRKMVEEHGLDLGSIPGTGSAGRVTKSDVLSFIETGPVAVPTPVPSTPAALAPAPTPAASAVTPASTTVPAGAMVPAWEGDRVEPWSRIRKLTADHMVMSRRVSAHVNSLMEIDYTHIAGIRKRQKAAFAERGVNLTYLAFIAKAIADNLRNHPVVNAAVSGDNTIYRRDINIGIAVALDWGLIVPVIRHADELSLLGVARSIQDLAERARTKKLAPEDVQRGTFTITNPGGFGTFVGTPIINQPQVAILAVGSIEKRPAVVTLPDGSDALGIRTKGMFCLAYDHRVVDGADADRFLADVRSTLHSFPEEQG